MTGKLLEINRLHTHFQSGGLFSGKKTIKAVNGVSLEIANGEVLSLVGESGCGKSTVGRTITKLVNATSGEICFEGQNILPLSMRAFRPLRRKIQMIFQDPFASLNPRRTVSQTLAEPLAIHRITRGRAHSDKLIAEALEMVGLDPVMARRYPHEFSGGERQRIGIARVMIVKPKLIIADEAVSALDVSIQAQILNLIKDLQRENSVSMLFISHDMGVVRYISDRVAVMYKGEIVELGSKRAIFENSAHPYTQKLLSAIPRIPKEKASA